MILVTLGTQDKGFPRLLEKIEKQCEEGKIVDKIIVQAGFTKFESEYMEIFDYIEQDKFAQLMNQADYIITHGGVGTIMTGLKENKKILAAARLHQYHEHMNDHQTQLLDSFEKAGYLIYMRDLDKIDMYLEKARSFTPATYQSNTQNMIKKIEDYIDSTK